MDLTPVVCALGIVAMLGILASQIDRLIAALNTHASMIDISINSLKTRVYECNRALIEEIRDYRRIEDYIKERDRYRDALWQIAHRDKPPTEYAAKALEEESQ